MSWDAVRWLGFWNSVNSASSSRTIMTQRAKLRRFAFIQRPSWARIGAQYKHMREVTYPLAHVGIRALPAKATEPILPYSIAPGPLCYPPPRAWLSISAARRSALDCQHIRGQSDHGAGQGAAKAPARRVFCLHGALQRLQLGQFH